MRLCAELRGGRYRKKKWDNRHSAGRKKLKRDPPSITRTRERERCVSHVSVKKLSSSQMTTNLHDFLRSFDIYRSRVVNFHKTSSTQRLSIPIAAVRSKKLRATPEKFVSISMTRKFNLRRRRPHPFRSDEGSRTSPFFPSVFIGAHHHRRGLAN